MIKLVIIDNRILIDNLFVMIKDLMELWNYSVVMLLVVENELMNNNLFYLYFYNEWFMNILLVMGNSSLFDL